MSDLSGLLKEALRTQDDAICIDSLWRGTTPYYRVLLFQFVKPTARSGKDSECYKFSADHDDLAEALKIVLENRKLGMERHRL